jgi:DnaK suppressor protein
MALTKKQIETLRDKLESEREMYLQLIREMSGHGTSTHGDAGDISTSINETELLWGLEEHEREALIDIEEAMKRLENGTYGRCQITGQEIPFARLDAIPTAKYTVDTQEKIDCGEIQL